MYPGRLAPTFAARCSSFIFALPVARRLLGFAVNLRLAEPEAVANIPIQRFEGLKSFEDLPLDGRCVGDYWF